ncbi:MULTISPECIES: transposase [Methanohalophilus]|jgi:hypothetical protein|uniref:Putative transposase of IS4/5 family n=1 Tax=Methanohalophilus euhalobius TaxID=51203 RepID=A0A285ERD9_9EURY|nr:MULTISPECIES: transposase [Methanohalophilus]ODV49428.1 MAG: TIS1421-transposase protein A [Methanohalophilus sp. 2-GBenrich]RSD33210.1 MAG: TIS1421-transposase protein A [Methanohalophilus sp.]RXG35180.1 TIS1421-transposase protein A [Methanohalophilus sp. WG1-DM]SNY00551.1 Putative transposase of IS4/5 family [Methanohalophilus euhalobius]
MEFIELPDEQWKYIKQFLPPQPITGRKRADDRKVINGEHDRNHFVEVMENIKIKTEGRPKNQTVRSTCRFCL